MPVSCPLLPLGTKNKTKKIKKDDPWKLHSDISCNLSVACLEISSMVWKQRCGQLCATSNVALGFPWALRGTQRYRLMGTWALVLGVGLEMEGEGWSGAWDSFCNADRERELEKGACLFGYVAGRLWMNWGLLSSLSPGKSLSVLAVTKATERKTEMRDTWGDRPEASTSLGLANVMSQYITSSA